MKYKNWKIENVYLSTCTLQVYIDIWPAKTTRRLWLLMNIWTSTMSLNIAQLPICLPHLMWTNLYTSTVSSICLAYPHQFHHANILATNKPKSSCNFLGIKRNLEAPKFLSLNLIGVHQIATSTNDTTPQGFKLWPLSLRANGEECHSSWWFKQLIWNKIGKLVKLNEFFCLGSGSEKKKLLETST